MDSSHKRDVIVVGAGAAGLTAALHLAKQDLKVSVLDGALHPGAENWSGCVFFGENLAHEEVLGSTWLDETAIERKLTSRGIYMTNGLDTAGINFKDSNTFKNCATVLRPVFDHDLSEIARNRGVQILSSTTVLGLIREDNKVIGVSTEKGPLYADLVFLAEGDAAHLVSKEGYNKLSDKGHFLQGIKEVVHLSEEKINERFGLTGNEGAAYEMIIRNARIGGKTVELNMGAFIYTNKESLSIGLVLPLDNLAKNFKGDHNKLMEWFKALPIMKKWTESGKRTAYGAKIINVNGYNNLSQFCDNGLAIGGACTGLGLDFPYPNFTGPASFTGLCLGKAVQKIKESNGSFDQASLEEHYEKAIKASSYYKDMKTTASWAEYMAQTKVLFSQFVDIKLDCQHPFFEKKGLLTAFRESCRSFFLHNSTGKLSKLVKDLTSQKKSCGATVGPFNILKSYFSSSPIPLPDKDIGDIRIEVFHDQKNVMADQAPIIGNLTNLATPAIKAAFNIMYRNHGETLSQRYSALNHVIAKRGFLVALLALISAPFVLLAVFTCFILDIFSDKKKIMESSFTKRLSELRKRQELSTFEPQESIESKLADIVYETEEQSHIKVHWPGNEALPEKDPDAALWHICPAGVYHAKADPTGMLRPIVDYENCIKCESCWRGSPLVDWGRRDSHRLIFRVKTTALATLIRHQREVAKSIEFTTLAEHNKPLDFGAEIHSKLKEISADFDRMHSIIHSSSRTLTANERIWLKQLNELISDKVHEIANETSLGRGHTLTIELLSSLEKIDAQLLSKRYFWADAEIQTIQQHTLRQLGFESKVNNSAINPESAKNPAADLDKHFTLPHLHKIKKEGLCNSDISIISELLQNSSPENEILITKSLAAIDLSLTAAYLHNRIAQSICQENRTLLICDDLTVNHDGTLNAEIPFGLSALAKNWLLIGAQGAWKIALKAEGLESSPVGTIGLRSCSPQFIKLTNVQGEKINHNGLGQLIDESTPLFVQAVISAGDYLIEKSVNHGTGRIQFPDLFQDEHGRDGIIKFGAVKSMISHMICRCESLKAAASSSIPNKMLYMQAGKWLGTQEGSFTYNATQVFGGTGFSEDDTLSPYYRDASIFKYLLGDPFKLQTNLESYSFKNSKFKSRPLLGDATNWMDKALSADREINDAQVKQLFRAETDFLFLQAVLVQFNQFSKEGKDLFAFKQVIDLLSRIYWNSALSRKLDSSAAERRKKCGQRLVKENWNHATVKREFNYEQFLNNTPAAPTGTFLLKPDFDSPRYSPENLHSDTILSSLRDELNQHFKEYFIDKDFDGLSYVRHAEKMHGQSDEVLKMFHDKGYMKLIIPEELGGAGKHKSEYYLLISASMRYGDPALSLIIQASTSIGTSPMLLAWKKDLPKAIEDVKALQSSKDKLTNWQEKCQTVINSLANPNLKEIQVIFKSIGDEVRVLSKKNSVFKSQSSGFMRKLMKAAQAGQDRQHELMGDELKSAIKYLSRLPDKFNQMGDEFTYRRNGVGFFLSIIASGQTSAFALTEPSAGSDTARVATRAELKEYELTLKNNAYTFLINGQEKTLIDLSQTRFNEGSLEIRLSETESWSPVKYDKYDWSDDTGYRYCLREGNEFIFHEFGTVRKDNEKLIYRCYELTGSKMWITNGRFAGLFALYAKTPAGVTGFCVDRYIDGLIIGKDEEKMGQNASPTNEIFLEKVRVCSSFILGIEGRGQVNALETLNVGRAGLALSSLALSEDILQAAAEHSQGQEKDFELLGQIAEEVIGGLPASYEMIGLFDKPGSDARMESAIGKYMNSEILHRSILYSEGIHGALSQTYQHDVEKKKRDARILNIYEGTNEIQRFLILKDLIEQISKKKPEEVQSNSDCAHIRRWGQCRDLLLDLVKKVKRDIGSKAWMDSQLQPVFFPLAETASWLKYTDGAIWRYNDLKNEEDNVISDILEGSIERGFHEINKRLQVFDNIYSSLQNGIRPAEITITNLYLDKLANENSDLLLQTHNINSTGEASAFLAAKPLNKPDTLILNGELIESVSTLTDGSEVLFKLIKGLPPQVKREIIIAAPNSAEQLILNLSSFADILWLKTGDYWPTADDCAMLWKENLPSNKTLLFNGSAPEWLAAANYVLTSNGFEGTEITELCWGKETLNVVTGGNPRMVLHSQSLILNSRFKESHLENTQKNGSIKVVETETKNLLEFLQAPEPTTQESAQIDTPTNAANYLKSQLNIESDNTQHNYQECVDQSTNTCLIGTIKDGEVSKDTTQAISSLSKVIGEFTLILVGSKDQKITLLDSAETLPGAVILVDISELWLRDCRLSAAALLQIVNKDSKLYFCSSRAVDAGIVSAKLNLSIKTGITRIEGCGESTYYYQERFTGSTIVKSQCKDKSVFVMSPSPEVLELTDSHEIIKVQRFSPSELDARLAVIKTILDESAEQLNIDSISDANFILDIGYGIGNQDNYDEFIKPLVGTLRDLGVNVSIGASRKLVETLKILPPETQIGQSGSNVAPTILIAIGISGAPQHINYIASNTVILSFNIDPFAPLMVLNESKPFPKVYPLPGDLKKTIPALKQALETSEL